MPDGGNFHPTRLITLRNPLTMDRDEAFVREGMTVEEIVASVLPERHAHLTAHVWISDPEMRQKSTYIPREYWSRVRPIKGAVVTIRVIPAGGGGGGGKSPLRTILTLAVVIAAVAIPAIAAAAAAPLGATMQSLATFGSFSIAGASFSVGGILMGAAISFVGNMVVNAIAPPPTSKLPDFAIGEYNFGTSTTPTLSITGTQNRANQYGVIPRIYGRMRVFPTFAAAPYTEIAGADQYLRLLFLVGYGPLELSEMKIGTVPLEQFEGVETEIRYGNADDEAITLYSNTVHEDTYSTVLRYNVGRTINTRGNTEEFTLDVTFQGLVTFGSDNSRGNSSVDIKLEYRVAGTVDWTDNGTQTITAATEQVYRYTFRVANLEAAEYEVRVTRLTADNTSTLTRNDVSITALRSITYSPPATPVDCCLIALRIKASNQLNGIIQSFNLIAEAKLPIWDGEAWSAPTVTRNPAWAFCDVLRGAGNKRPIADERIDLDAILAWAEACDELAQDEQPKFYFDAVIDQRTTIFQMLNNIAATARAVFSLRDGKYSIVRDAPQATPTQLFTPRNSWGFKGRKAFVEAPHALRCRYIDPNLDWQQSEVLVYRDGYSAANATMFETMDMLGVTRANQAWRDGRFHMAVGQLRPESYELYADMEHLACQRGDKVMVQHDITRWGLGAGRVKSITTAGSPATVTSITLDAKMLTEVGQSYAIRLRKADGTQSVLALAPITTTEETATLTFADPPTVDAGPEVGDLVAFGESDSVTVALIVKNIFRNGTLNARLELVDEAPSCHTADSGTIPAFSTLSTWARSGVNLDPAKPVIEEVASDENAMFQTASGFVPAIRLTFAQRSGVINATDFIEAQIRRSGSGAPYRPFQPFNGTPSVIYLTPIDDGAQYDIRVRYVTVTGRASDWTSLTSYTAQGRLAPPPDVESVTIHNGSVSWLYPSPPNDLAGFRVLYNIGVNYNPALATLAHSDGSVVWSPFSLANVPSGTVTLFVYAMDSAGNASENPAICVLNVGDRLTGNVVETIDFAAIGFAGTHDNATVNAGVLEADPTTLFWGASAAIFWPSAPGTFWPTTEYYDFVYETTFVPSADWTPVQMTLAAEVTAEHYTVEYQRGDLTPFWPTDTASLFWGGATELLYGAAGDWTPWPGALNVGHEEIGLRLSLVSAAGGQQASISSLVASFDVPDITETLLDQTLDAGGSRLPVTETYRAIKNVRLDVVENGSGAITAKIMDRLATGPLIQAFDATGTGVAGKVNATVEGY